MLFDGDAFLGLRIAFADCTMQAVNDEVLKRFSIDIADTLDIFLVQLKGQTKRRRQTRQLQALIQVSILLLISSKELAVYL